MNPDTQIEKPEGLPADIDYLRLAKSSVTYQSYLLRLWHEGTTQKPWRIMLESITESGERQHFSDLESLFTFLQTQIDLLQKSVFAQRS